jgi:GT2 family glycosyltransferase
MEEACGLLISAEGGNPRGMPTTVAVSIVIPTYNRRDRLARVLDALDRQSVDAKAFEVVVVDDGSTDGTSAWLRTQHRGYAIQAIQQENGGPARARNAGVARANAAVLLFLDDDVEPTPKLVEEHIRSHEHDTNVVVIGPMGSLPHYEQPWVAWEQVKLEAQYAAMVRRDWEPTFRQFWTGNASVRKDDVLSVGGFDPSFSRAEDVELGLRLSKRGLKFRFNPEARGLHHAERPLESWANVQRSYGRFEVEIFKQFGEQTLVDLLAGNWSRLHPAARWIVRQCAGNPRRHAGVTFVLQNWLSLAPAAHLPAMSGKVCSTLAQLLYWQASLDALGPERSERVLSGR